MLNWAKDFKFIVTGEQDTFSNKNLLSLTNGFLKLNPQSGSVTLVCPSSPWLEDPKRRFIFKSLANIYRLDYFPHNFITKEIYGNGAEIRLVYKGCHV